MVSPSLWRSKLMLTSTAKVRPLAVVRRHLAQHGLGGEGPSCNACAIGQKPLQRATQRVVRGALEQRRLRWG